MTLLNLILTKNCSWKCDTITNSLQFILLCNHSLNEHSSHENFCLNQFQTRTVKYKIRWKISDSEWKIFKYKLRHVIDWECWRTWISHHSLVLARIFVLWQTESSYRKSEMFDLENCGFIREMFQSQRFHFVWFKKMFDKVQ